MECDYCGTEIPKSEGKMLVRANGERVYFCSGKCEKNYKNNRKHGYPEKEE